MSKDKYDRQTRLWGEGQVLISTASVLCFNSDTLASEVLKNLVLSGVGKVTIIDDTIVSQKDLENNFFLPPESLNKPRANIILENLLELNPDVHGEAVIKAPSAYVKDEGALAQFDVFISCNQPEEFNSLLYDIVKKLNKRLVMITSCGLLNMIRLYENYHANMKLRLLETPVNDHRLSMPWKELIDFSNTFELDKMDEGAHCHVPYFVILIKALLQYREKKNDQNANPNTRDEKNEFKEIIKSMIKFKDEENFNEALGNYYLCNKDKNNLITPKIEYIFQILKDHPFDELMKESNDIMKVFFIYCQCLKEYYDENNKTFPLVGNIPDMTADTQSYIKLKKIYQTKAEEDRKKMHAKIQDKLSKLSFENKDKVIQLINSPHPDKEVDIVDILNKNWPQMSLFKYEFKDNLKLNLDEFDEDYQKVNLKWFILFKASEMFNAKNNRYPGTIDNFKEDVPLLKAFVSEYIELLKKANDGTIPIDGVSDEFIFEFCRMGKGQIAPCISMIGSMASQETIKMITYQFDTVNSTIIYDGINVTLSTFKL